MHIHQRSWIGCASYVVLALACLVVTHRGAEAGQTRMKVVLDTDIGTDIDDAWALGYALKSPSFELLGRDRQRRRHAAAREDGVQAPPPARPHRRARCRRPQDRRCPTRSRRLPVHVGRGLPRLRARRDACESSFSRMSSAGILAKSRSSPSARCRTSATSCASTLMSCRS